MPITAPTKNWRFSTSYDSFVVQQTFVLRMNICGRNRQLLVAANRYRQNRMKITNIILLFFFAFNFTAKAQTQKHLTKKETVELYKKLYQTSEIDSIIWNGNKQKCICGTLNNEIYKKAENRINFFRTVNGLNKVKLNPKLNQEAQNAALLVLANNQLTHYPARSMKCYSESASNGCVKSCLGFSDFKNFPATGFITSFIWDFGQANYFVGHRKWILYSKLIEFGYGATNKSEAILTADGISYDSVDLPEYVAYPWNGYVPINLIFPKWSFSIPENKKVDFSKTIITMTDQNGKSLKLNKLEIYPNYLDHTIVWTATDIFSTYDISYGINNLEKNGFLNKKITVRIKNVKVDGEIKNYEYIVEPIKI